MPAAGRILKLRPLREGYARSRFRERRKRRLRRSAGAGERIPARTKAPDFGACRASYTRKVAGTKRLERVPPVGADTSGAKRTTSGTGRESEPPPWRALAPGRCPTL